MATKSYQLNITKSDGTNETVSFTVPARSGTYKVKFTLSNGQEIDAGNITVDDTEHSYEMKFTLSDGSTINAGTLVTPVGAPPFADASWTKIAEISEAGNASEYFAVGDEKTIELSTGEEITLVVLGFNHDDLTDGSGKAGMTIGMKNLLATTYRINPTSTSANGWDGSEMRTSTMATLFSQLPSDLQSVIKQVNKKATAGRQSTSITTSADKLWLLAMSEIFSATSIENSTISNTKNYADAYKAEGTQYKYYENLIGDNDQKDNPLLIKKLSNGSGKAEDWWWRSPYLGTNNAFYFFGKYGNCNGNSAPETHGVCFGFSCKKKGGG